MTVPIKTEKLGSQDVAWLRMDAPTNPMTVVGLLVLEQPIGADQLARLLEQRLLVFDRFRQRIQMGPSPAWITDTRFDIAAHVHAVALPPPADKRALEGLVGDLLGARFDLTRPPWQVHLVREYEGGSAVIIRLHHSIADGIALVRVLLSLGDEHFARLDPARLPSYGQPPRNRSVLESIARPMGRTIVGAGRLAGAVAGGAVDLARRPVLALDWARAGLSFAAAASRIALLPADTPTRFKGELGVSKRVSWSSAIPLSQVKAAGRASGAKVNDVLLSSVAGGLRRYLIAQGDPVDGVEIGSVIPVNLRPAGTAFDLGNEFGLVFLSLPLGIADPAERLREVRRRMDRLKASSEPIVAYTILRAIGAGPSRLHREVVNLLSAKCSAAITNVPGPRRRLHLGGRVIRHVMFWVPRAGHVGLGISILSYAGGVHLGIASDARLAPDPEAIIAELQNEFDALAERR